MRVELRGDGLAVAAGAVQRILGCAVIHITPHMRAWVTVQPMDFRAGIDGLAAACGKRLVADPLQRRAVRLRQPRPHGNQRPGLRRPGLLGLPLGSGLSTEDPGANIQSEGRAAHIQIEHAGTSRS